MRIKVNKLLVDKDNFKLGPINYTFDEGYVYRFLDGNGDETCDRLPITGGTLNDIVILTYHDGGTEWQNALSFKYKRQPTTLILQDNDYLTYTFEPTDLNHALELLSTKSIIDY